MTTNDNDQVKRFFDWLKRHKLPATLIIVGTIIIDLGSFTDALGKISRFISPTPTSPPAIPAFSGEIGQLENGESFNDFMDANRGKIVKLDAYMREDQFYGSAGRENPSLIVWFQCNSLSEPLDNINCEGFRYLIRPSSSPTDYVFGPSGLSIQLKGYFLVGLDSFSNDGFIFIPLEPLDSKEVLLKLLP